MSDFYGHTELRLIGDDANGYVLWMRRNGDGSTCEWQPVPKMTAAEAAEEDDLE